MEPVQLSSIIKELENIMNAIDLRACSLDPFKLELYNNCLHIRWRYNFTDRQMLHKIIFCSQPKSGTKQVEKMLALLEYKRMYAPYDQSEDGTSSTVWQAVFNDPNFTSTRYFMSGHIAASEINTKHIIKTDSMLILLIRNPLQSIVSYCYYIENLSKKCGDKIAFSAFNSFGLLYAKSEKITSALQVRDFMIKVVYPRLILFIDSWMNQLKLIKPDNYVILSQEHMSKYPDIFYKNILKKLNVCNQHHEKFIKKMISTTNHNFRRGSVDEWRDFFDSNELKTMMPLMQRILNEHKILNTLFLDK